MAHICHSRRPLSLNLSPACCVCVNMCVYKCVCACAFKLILSVATSLASKEGEGNGVQRCKNPESSQPVQVQTMWDWCRISLRRNIYISSPLLRLRDLCERSVESRDSRWLQGSGVFWIQHRIFTCELTAVVAAHSRSVLDQILSWKG